MLDKLMAARQQMENLKKILSETIVEGASENGWVRVICSADKEIKEIIISPEIIGDIDALQDLTRVAVNKALIEASRVSEAETAKITAALLPGINL